jgi:hypothetical protein
LSAVPTHSTARILTAGVLRPGALLVGTLPGLQESQLDLAGSKEAGFASGRTSFLAGACLRAQESSFVVWEGVRLPESGSSHAVVFSIRKELKFLRKQIARLLRALSLSLSLSFSSLLITTLQRSAHPA